MRGKSETSRRRLADALLTVARSPRLLRGQLSFLGSRASTWATRFAISIVAYHHGGAAAVGLVGILQTLPASVLAPLAGSFVDRWHREWALFGACACSAATLIGAWLLLRGSAPVGYVYTLVVVASVARAVYRPLYSALLPSMCFSPYELTSANAVRGILEGLAAVLGPALAWVAANADGISAAFLASAVMSTASAFLIVGVDRGTAPRVRHAPNAMFHFVEGLREPLTNRDLTLLTGLAACQSFTRGALSVFMVVISIKMLGLGTSGVAWLMTALGGGGLVGAVVTSAVVRRQLASWFALGLALMGLPLVVLGLLPGRVTAFVLVALVGLGSSFVDAGAFTLIARVSASDVLVRVFAVFEGVISLAVSIGAVVTPIVIAAVGLRHSLMVIGALCPVVVALSWLRLRLLESGIASINTKIDLLRGVPILRPLPLPSLERLARVLDHDHVPAGREVFHQGDIGDRFYVIEQGRAEVSGDSRAIIELQRGSGFGEIALLRQIPRTATVKAVSDLDLASVTGNDFVAVVSGNAIAAMDASAHVDRQLERFSPAPSRETGA